MPRGESKKTRRLRIEAKEVRVRKRDSLLRCVLAFFGVIAITLGRHILAIEGIAPYGTVVVDMISYGLTIVLCFIAAPATMRFFRARRRLKEIEFELD